MRLSSLVGHCREVLLEILGRPEIPADAVIARFFRDRRYLGSGDRGFIAETVYGTLRRFLRYRFLLFGKHEGQRIDPGREAPGSLLAYLIEQETRNRPEILEGARLTRGELERITRALSEGDEEISMLPEPEQSAVRYSLPVWLVDRLLPQFGEDAPALFRSCGEAAPVTIRANRLLTDRDKLAVALQAQGIETTPCVYAPDGLVLEKRLNANSLPEFKEGHFEIQDEGSQLLSIVFDPHPNWKVFDACAGAGGKALHMAALMKGRGEIHAHDINDRRLKNLKPRLRRSGAQNIRVTDHQTYRKKRSGLAGTFDGVLIDAPCTGTGTLRRNPGMILGLEPATLRRVTSLQATILDQYSRLVKPGGTLFYATCSLLEEENDAQVAGFLARNEGWTVKPVEGPEGTVTAEGHLRLLPHIHGTDGFFGAMLVKDAG